MASLIFEPWIGKHFHGENRFGVRVLVLGESHYGQEAETSLTFTSNVVKSLAQDERNSFFTKVSKILLGLDGDTWLDDATRAEVWEHVAFYNYIQGFVSTDSRVRPTTEMWEAAKEPFLHVLKTLQPKIVLVLGKALATHLPEPPPGIEFCCIQHPSTGFVYSRWNPFFSNALKRAKESARQDIHEV